MRIIMFDKDGDQRHELLDVVRRFITPGGDFVALHSDKARSGKLTTVVARGTWDHLEEWGDFTGPDLLAGQQLVENTLRLDDPPVVPGHTPDPFLAGPTNPHAGKLADAMAVHCVCASLRCPVLVEIDKPSWWRQTFGSMTMAETVATLGAGATVQCGHEIGHDAPEVAHDWREGMWPYGPHNHHPKCPRNPEVYNRPQADAVEGQPQPAAGITAAPAAPPVDSATASVGASANLAPAWVTDRTLIRPYVAEHRARAS